MEHYFHLGKEEVTGAFDTWEGALLEGKLPRLGHKPGITKTITLDIFQGPVQA